MRRFIFSWNQPEGPCDVACDVCGRSIGSCLCPECPECGETGNSECYSRHGLAMSAEQIDGFLGWLDDEGHRLYRRLIDYEYLSATVVGDLAAAIGWASR